MTNSLETKSYQKATTGLRLDHKLVTSLQILQMPVKELEQFLEEKLLVNPLIPLELLKPKELLLEDLGITVENCAADPLAENLFWQSLYQNETEKSVLEDPSEEILYEERTAPIFKMSPSSLSKENLEHEIDLFIFFQGSKWKVVSPQPYEPIIEKALLAQKNLNEQKSQNTPFWKELINLQYALSSRKNLLISIGHEITASWNSIFQNGEPAPLDLSETAKRLGRHRTTLFRAIKGKKLFTPQGILSLDALFEGKRAKNAKQRKKY